MNGITKDILTNATFVKAKSYTDFPLRKRSNWLIHMLLVRQETDKCLFSIDHEFKKNTGRSEYSIYAKGLILRQEGKILQSLDCFKSCQQLNPSNPQNVKQQGYSLSLLGRNLEAIDKYEEAEKLSIKRDWEIYYHIGRCSLLMGDYEKAKNNLENAFSLNHMKEDVAHKLAQVYVHLDKTQAAIKVYEEALKHDPTNGDFAVKLCCLLLDGEDKGWKKSLERLNLVLNHDPNHSAALLASGALLQEQGQLEKALAKYHTALESNPYSSALWNNIGLCFLGKKKYLAAVGCLKRALLINTFSSDVAHNLGLIYLSMGQFASAGMYLSQALSIARKSSGMEFSPIVSGSKYGRSWIVGQGYVLLAATLYNLGDVKNAKRAHQMAMNTEQDDPLPPLSYATFLWDTEAQNISISDADKERCLLEIRRLLDEFHKRVDRGVKRAEPRMIETARQLTVALKTSNKNQ